jgi:hypothetical protein
MRALQNVTAYHVSFTRYTAWRGKERSRAATLLTIDSARRIVLDAARLLKLFLLSRRGLLRADLLLPGGE